MVAQFLPERIAETERLAVDPHLKQLLRMGHRQRLQHDGVDQTEDRRIGANAERERKNRDGGKPGTGAQRSNGVTNVLESRVEHRSKAFGNRAALRRTG